MASTTSTRAPRLRIPSFPSRTSSTSRVRELGSAHVSVELQDGDQPVCIKSECTTPTWTEQPMLYCGQQSNGLFLYTMLYEDVPVGPVQFRVIVGGEPHLENEFYTQVQDEEGNTNMIVQSWVFPTPQTITPDDDDLPESLRSPLFAHERKPDEPWRKHRKQKSVHFPTAPYSPAKSESSPRRATVSLSSPPMSPTSIPLQPILEEVDGAALSDMEEDALMFKEEMDDPLTFKEDVNAGKRKDSSVL